MADKSPRGRPWRLSVDRLRMEPGNTHGFLKEVGSNQGLCGGICGGDVGMIEERDELCHDVVRIGLGQAVAGRTARQRTQSTPTASGRTRHGQCRRDQRQRRDDGRELHCGFEDERTTLEKRMTRVSVNERLFAQRSRARARARVLSRAYLIEEAFPTKGSSHVLYPPAAKALPLTVPMASGPEPRSGRKRKLLSSKLVAPTSVS
jgi:hypothetical protein